MFALRNLLCAALAVSLLFSASEAEARFGKRSNSSNSEEKEEKKDHEEKQPRRPVHDASAVGSRPPPPPPRPAPPSHVVVVEPDYHPTYIVTPAPRARVAPSLYLEREDTVRSAFRLGVDGGPMSEGVGMNLFLAFEGELVGLDGRVTGLSLPTDDGTEGSDSITVTGVHLTYAVLAEDLVRWRVEAGLSSAHAPDLVVLGPSMGTSLDVRLMRPLDLEARLQVTPFPYRQLDAQAGLAFKPSPFLVRAGWRMLMLDDAGLVDGVVHRDVFNGPYVGLGLVF